MEPPGLVKRPGGLMRGDFLRRAAHAGDETHDQDCKDNDQNNPENAFQHEYGATAEKQQQDDDHQ